MWEELDSSAILVDVYGPLHLRANFDRKWSIAELSLSQQDVDWLCSWLGRQRPSQLSQWLIAPSYEWFDGRRATTSQMLGSLIVCAGAERCRELSREDAVWPTIRAIFPQSSELFHYGQPSELTRGVIADAVRALNLRHAMDLDDTQRWYMTIKLQYGFTYRGAKNRLAEWLVNLGTPQAVQYLLSGTNDIACDKFQSLWNTLKGFRRAQINEQTARKALAENPWIKPHWLDDLLRQAQARIETLGLDTTSSDTPKDSIEAEAACPIAGIRLDWPEGQNPKLMVAIDKDAILELVTHYEEIGRIDFFIDGERRLFWTRNNDDTWHGDSEIRIDNAPVRSLPKSLFLKARGGEKLIAWDFSDSGLGEELVFFDLDRDRIVLTPHEQLNPSTRYAMLCDPKSQLIGAEAQVYQPAGAPKKLLRLPVPLPQHLTVQFGDFVLSQPVRECVNTLNKEQIQITTSNTPLNTATHLLLHGIPDDTEEAELLIHKTIHQLEWQADYWRSAHPIVLTPQLCAGQRRVRVRFRIKDNWRTLEPRLRLRVYGAAVEDHNLILRVIPSGSEVNRSNSSVYLRVWAPEPEDTTLWEGNCKIRQLRGCKIRLKDLLAYGGELSIVNGQKVVGLGIRCVDRGRIEDLQPSLLGHPGALQFSEETDPKEFGSDGNGGDGYAVWTWAIGDNQRAQFIRLPPNALQPNATRTNWPIAMPPRLLAVALSWKGTWLGAWWDLNRLSGYLVNCTPEATTFALLKWLRTPVLHPDLEPIIAKKIREAPCNFLHSWRSDKDLPTQLRASFAFQDTGSVIRHFLWTNFPENAHTAALHLLAGWQANAAGTPNGIARLSKVVDVSLHLMWGGMKQVLLQNPAQILPLLCAFISARLSLDIRITNLQSMPSNQMKSISFVIGKSLQNRRARVSAQLEIDPDSLDELARRWLVAADHGEQLDPSEISTLKRIAEYESARNYFTCRRCAEWLNILGMDIQL